MFIKDDEFRKLSSGRFGNCRLCFFIIHDEFRKLSSGRAFDDCLFFILHYTYCTFTIRCKRSIIIRIIQVMIALFLSGVYMKAFIFRSAV